MTPIIRIAFLLLLALVSAQATTRSDINTIEAAERIRYLSQRIAKDFLYLYARPKRSDIRMELDTLVDELSINFTTIASSTKNDQTQDLLKFLEYSQENIKELLKKKTDKDGVLQMLDYSETLLEGSRSLFEMHRYPFNKEETMLIGIKRDEYLAESLGKFYMASHLGTLTESNKAKMKASAQKLQEGVEAIRKYPYPDLLQKTKGDLSLFLNASTYTMEHARDIFVPNLMDIASNYFEELLSQYALYHSKSQ